VWLTDGASLTGFTLTNGMGYGGGGVYCPIGANAVVTNCVIVGNSAPGYTANGFGGGAYGGALYNCLLWRNNAAFWGGGAALSTLYNCTVVSNSAGSHVGVGGTAQCTLYNSILYRNTLGFDPDPVMNYDPSCTLTYCCASPLPSGEGNIDAYPEFVDYAGGNLRLQSNSPCIDAGTNWYAARPTDLDGRPRLVGRVDMGAYEFQPSVSGAFIGWLQQWGLPTDGSADYADVDADGLNNWQEWVCQTCPINLQSALRLVSAAPTGPNATVIWQSVAGVNYFLLRSPDLAAPSALVATNIPGQLGTTTYADTNATGAGPFYYRVGVQAP